MSITIPGALADHLAAQHIDDEETAAALDAARRGRGRTLVIEPTSTRVLHVISRHAEHILSIRGAYTRAQIDAARLWIKRAGHAPAEDGKYAATVARAEQRLDAVEAELDEQFATAAHALDAVEYAEHVEAAVETVEDAEALYAVQLVTEADATDGTWRGAWIGQQSDDGLFALEPAAEQGALFDDRAALEPAAVEPPS
ncbi:hypothetical protein [Streptomyces sioyaensis]|uniref:hypothetical protein n=1 Tax=Streptomyces sioyaensis TaxID=67364 RepID=UPI0036EBC496